MQPGSSMSYDALVKCVAADDWDFVSWTKLLAVVEASALRGEGIDRVVPSFEGFLRRFPLCFGYWCKYADLQTVVVGGDEVMRAKTTIYERAVEAIPLSAELWTAYCGHSMLATAGKNSQSMRELYQRAMRYVGAERQAVSLWEAFLEFEASRGTPASVCAVYKKALAVDTTGRIDELWRKFKLLTRSYKISELIEDSQDMEGLLTRYKARKQFEVESTAEEARRLKSMAGYSALEEQRQLEQFLYEIEQAKNENIQERIQRQLFEAGIRRTYFHVKPLDEPQLENWRQYLSHEMQHNKNTEAVDHLFERCLIPCALYAEFWMSYALWKHKSQQQDPKPAIKILQRATATFIPMRPDALEMLAQFYEAAGQCDDARRVYIQLFEAAKPDASRLAACCIKRAYFETRQHDYTAALAAFRTTLHITDGPHYEYIASQMAKYQALVTRDLPAARATLDYALSNKPENPRLWLARIQLEMMQMYQERLHLVVDLVSAVYERAIAPQTPLTVEHKLDLWSRYLYFMQTYAYNVTAVLDLKRRLAEARTSLYRQFDTTPLETQATVNATSMPDELLDIPNLTQFNPAPFDEHLRNNKHTSSEPPAFSF